jgi:hypothetical protein
MGWFSTHPEKRTSLFCHEKKVLWRRIVERPHTLRRHLELSGPLLQKNVRHQPR